MEARSAYLDCLFRLVNSAYGICITDTTRKVLFWNDAAENMSGYRRDEIVGRFCYDNILCCADEQGREICSENCPPDEAMKGRRPAGLEAVYLKHREGHRVPVEVAAAPVFNDSGEVIGSVQLFHDITRRMEKERALLVKSQKLETVLESIREGVLFIDTAGRINVYNNALSEMFSLGDEDLCGAVIFSLADTHPLKRAIFRSDKGFQGPYCWEINRCPEERADCPEHASKYCRCWIFSSYRAASPFYPTCIDCPAYERVKKFLERPKELDLGERTFSVSSSFVEVRERNEIWEVIVFRDVTADKADAVAKLAGGAAHELRQPMQAILSAASILKKETPPNEAMSECLDIIGKSCSRMDELVKKIGEIAKYRVKSYTKHQNILDIDQSSGA